MTSLTIVSDLLRAKYLADLVDRSTAAVGSDVSSEELVRWCLRESPLDEMRRVSALVAADAGLGEEADRVWAGIALRPVTFVGSSVLPETAAPATHALSAGRAVQRLRDEIERSDARNGTRLTICEVGDRLVATVTSDPGSSPVADAILAVIAQSPDGAEVLARAVTDRNGCAWLTSREQVSLIPRYALSVEVFVPVPTDDA